MPNPVIKIEDLSKLYRVGELGTGTLSHDLNRWVQTRLLGREDPYIKIGAVNNREKKAQKGEHIWALRDINLEVNQGEVLGIIGKNGAGKSTLLKILSRVTSPTKGSIKVRGRLASLLEVGTGFHPELTGRENIFMNGTIMGMRKWEVQGKLEEIVEFAGVAKYLDTPVKRYSSGMTVRLGFAVAAHLEPEILVVDEVLAVGDAEFQKKAIGKMQDVSRGEGRTILFVSHNMTAVKQLCNSGIVIQNGEVVFSDNIHSTVEYYLDDKKNSLLDHSNNQSYDVNAPIQIRGFDVKATNGQHITVESGISFEILLYINKKGANLTASLNFYTLDNLHLFEAPCFITIKMDSKVGLYTLAGKIPPYLLNSDKYEVRIVVAENQKYILLQDFLCTLDIEDSPFNKGANINRISGLFRPNVLWDVKFEEVK